MMSVVGKVKKKLTWSWRDLLFSLRMRSIPKVSSGRLLLVYHGVTKHARNDINSRFISTTTFEKHLSFFKKHFNIVTVEDYFKGAKHPDKLTIALTFDDGYLNNLTEALPLLEKYEVPATFYITTIREAGFDILWADALDLYRHTGPSKFTFENETFNKGKHAYQNDNGSLKQLLKDSDWGMKKKLVEHVLSENNFLEDVQYHPFFKLMSEEDIKALASSSLASIGSHGLYHNCLDKITLEEVKRELSTCKTYLENIIGKPVTSLAFPDGSYSSEILDLAETLGYKTQLAVDYLDIKDVKDPRVEERMGINPYISFNNQMECIIRGNYQ